MSISFILSLLLDEKEQLPPGMRKRCLREIKDLESQLESKPKQVMVSAAPIQAPSTQRLLDQQNDIITHKLGAPILPTNTRVDKETGRAMVPTGAGTYGPKKF